LRDHLGPTSLGRRQLGEECRGKEYRPGDRAPPGKSGICSENDLGGVGKVCREREAAVNERRQAVDAAMHNVEHTADPQTEAAIRIVAWLSRGMVQPTGDDFAMLRLILLALLPQIGGILLMVGRYRA
jgi:hypothetical protein